MAIEESEARVSLMPLDTPVLKVSRPVAACSRCRNAKIKCDGKLPACTSCEKTGRAAECTSTNDQFARGKERSYVSTLETRIDRLQAKLEEARARKPSVISIADDDAMTTVPSRRTSLQTPEPPTPSTSKALRRQEAADIDDLVSDFGFLSVNATARDFHGFTATMSYARLVLSACSKDPLPEGMAQPLPPRYTATSLIQHYLNNIFSLLPVFDEASFYGSVEVLYSRNARQADPADHFMVRMVLAIASMCVSEARGDHNYMSAIGHVCAALEHAEGVLKPGSIVSIQALILLTEYAMLDPHHFDSWSLVGAASRAMVDIGMHQDPPKGTAMPKSKLDIRRRVFYCVYNLDRSTSLVQTRAFSFSDDSVKVKVPYSKKPSSTPTSPGGLESTKNWLRSHDQALELVELRKLQSTWYTELFQSGRTRWDEPYPYLWDTCDSMRKWFDNLPASTSPNARAFFEAELLYSWVYILSPSPRVPNVSPYAQKLVFEYCIKYADLMLRLVSDHSYRAPLTFYDAMRVYMTGRQFLELLQLNLETLLNGHTPQLPDVKPTTAPPPSMPSVAVPPQESVHRFNIIRSITCIKHITDCLARFGIRWGYMSWNQRFQKETAHMLENLNARLREMDEHANGIRRQSMWQHHNSTGSVTSSSSGSASAVSQPTGPAFHSPPLTGPPGRPPMLGQHPSPPYQPPQMPMYQVSAPQMPQSIPQSQPHTQYAAPLYHYGQTQAHLPNSSMMSHTLHSHPTHQFASWQGYAAPPASGAPDNLDEENAVPPLAT